MVRKVKFPLEMADGVQVRNLEALKENFDVEKVIAYFLDGKLQTWLADRYYEEEAESVAALSKDDGQLGKKLSEIFGIECSEEEVDIEEISWKNERLAKIKQLTDDDEIIKNADYVAFNQEELAELYDEGVERIYLCEGEFTIPKSKQDLEYIEFGGAKVMNRKPKPEKTNTKPEKIELELRREKTFSSFFTGKGSLFIKGTEEMVNDDTENVQRYIVIPDNRVVYAADCYTLDEDLDEYDGEGMRLFVKTIGGEKKMITSSEDIELLYADEAKVIWRNEDDEDFSYYFDSGKKTMFFDEDYNEFHMVTIDNDLLFFICDNILYMTNLKEETDAVEIHDDIAYARFAEGKIYFITYTLPPDISTRALYSMNMDNKNVELIADLGYLHNDRIIVKNNKVYYFKLHDSILHMLDLTDKTIRDITKIDGIPTGTIYITEKDGYIHYSVMNSVMAKSASISFRDEACKFKIKCDGTGTPEKSDIEFTDEDRIDYYPCENYYL